MTVDILVPPLSQTMDSLILVQWVKNLGDAVVKGETLFTVETDKATLEVESPATGTLATILAQPGDEIKIHSVIGSIAEPGEVVGVNLPPAAVPVEQQSQTTVSAPTPPIRTSPQISKTLPTERQKRIFASPRARHLAQVSGIDITGLRGTGPQNMIVENDVKNHLEKQKSIPPITPVARHMAEEARSVKLSPTRKTIAHRMTESHQSTAPVTYMSEVDATGLVELRQRILDSLPEGAPRPTFTDFMVSITARVLDRHSELNATFDGETVHLFEAVDISLAVDTERGLIVPVIRNAQNLGIADLAKLRSDLVARALDGSITVEELAGGTFTITNLGTLGIDFFTPIINPPQVAILGVGKIRAIPAVHKGEICIRQVMGLALTCDHRVIDGAPAARFLRDICALVEKPELIWL